MAVILGIDPSTISTGIAFYRDGAYAWSGVIAPKGDNAILRSAEIVQELGRLIDHWHTNEVACERLQHHIAPSHETYALIGSIKSLVKSKHLPFFILTPSVWRPMIAGVPGNSKKVDVIGMLLLRYREMTGKPADEIEARAIAEAHVTRRKLGLA